MAKIITTADFAKLLETRKGATFVTTETVTDPDMRKTGNPFIGVKKLSVVNGTIGYIYDNVLVNRAAKEGIVFSGNVKPHAWGDMNHNHTLRINRKSGDKYLSIMIKKCLVPPRYIMPNGTEIPAADLKPYMPEKYESSTQDCLEEKIIVRDYKLASIVSIRMDGEAYTVIHTVDTPVNAPATIPA